MKQLFVLLAIIFFFWACSGPKGVVKVDKEEPDSTVEMDSIAYGMETFDSKFETWYALHKIPANYRSQKYYENWNKQYVKEWNSKARQMGKSAFFEPIVGYNPKQNYGFDFNHKLFFYFQYVENVLKMEILPGGPKEVAN
jgi:hypothetical protein